MLAGIAIAVVAVLAVGGWRLSRAPADAATAMKDKDGAVPPLVTVVVPALGKVGTTVSLTGLISATNDMPIGVEGDGGRVSAVLVEPGDHVKRGQVLARLNPLTAETQVDSAQASYEELKAAAASSQAEYARAERARDSFSVEEFERRRTNALTAEAKAKAAGALLAEARSRWQRMTVLAPSDGVVLTRAAEIGQIATPGSPPLFRLARDGAIEMRGEVAEQDMPRLRVGQTAMVRLDGVPQPFAGRVWQVGAVIDGVTRQGTVRIALPSQDQNLRPGAFARADIEADAMVGVIVPQTAVLSDEQGTYTLIVGANDKVERRAINVVGARATGMLVDRGLTGDERVVAVAGAFLRTGEQVKVAPIAVAAGGSGDSGKNMVAGSGAAAVSAP